MTAPRTLAQPVPETVTDHDTDGVPGAAMANTAGIDRDWLHQFALTVRTGTRASLAALNTCVLTTRVGLAVLEAVGVSARPAPVYVTVHNREAWRLASEGVPVADWPNSAHSVGVDERMVHPLPGGGWNGHLVLVVKRPGEPRLLIDLTADQFDRPIRNLIVGGPIFMDLPAEKPWTPRDPLFTTIGGRSQPDAIVSYRPMPPGHPEAKRWTSSPDWTDGSGFVEEFVEGVLDRLPPPGRATLG